MFYDLLYGGALRWLDAENAHRLAIASLAGISRVPGAVRALGRWTPEADPRLAVERWGRTFPNCLGLAAGMDKDAQAIDAFLALGFGHVELGTITLRPQLGNPRPRIWRVPACAALINSMGFPSAGAQVVAARMQRRMERFKSTQGLIGLNIGKNKDTPLERAAEDYEALVQTFAGIGDYFAINISSPNTAGLRDLQLADRLSHLVRRTVAAAMRAEGSRRKPVLIKLAPDLDDHELEPIAQAALDGGADGLIATNTTTTRPSFFSAAQQQLPGGLSGPPLRQRATEVVRLLYRVVGSRLPIIGVGGISSAEDVLERIRAGASLVQLYTALVYQGPSLPGHILRQLSEVADVEGWGSIDELVGTDLRVNGCS
jgi:dihydroorotate dehydrogenase